MFDAFILDVNKVCIKILSNCLVRVTKNLDSGKNLKLQTKINKNS